MNNLLTATTLEPYATETQYNQYYDQPFNLGPQVDYNRQWALNTALAHLGKDAPFKAIFDLADEIYGYVVK
jgi:hypothetical protein